MSLADSINVTTFLSDYWQKQPLLIRDALPGFTDFLSPEELAGLACEDMVETRIVFSRGDQWDMKPGPFTERDFKFLPETDWTLLVQSVDHWLPEVQSLLQQVPFIPAWRLDDVMISYAARDGGVGPHFDYYDVFLIQGEGSRQWQLGQRCDSTTALNTDSGMKILETFVAEESVELHTGDILYIPAGVAHWGTAIAPGLCYSIGFRAPDLAELLAAFSDEAARSLGADIRYRDPALSEHSPAGAIDADALKQVRALLHHVLDDDALLLRSFGNLMTDPRLPELLAIPETQINPAQMAVMLQKGARFARNPAARFACHHRHDKDQDSLYFFVNGECLDIPATDKLLAMNEELQAAFGRPLNLSAWQRHESCLQLLAALYNRGCLDRV